MKLSLVRSSAELPLTNSSWCRENATEITSINSLFSNVYLNSPWNSIIRLDWRMSTAERNTANGVNDGIENIDTSRLVENGAAGWPSLAAAAAAAQNPYMQVSDIRSQVELTVVF